LKALILSDTHGMVNEVLKLVQKIPELKKGFHCGDFCVSPSTEPFRQMVLVKGNNDDRADIPYDELVHWSGLRFFVTHGHKYGVEHSLLQLKYKAEELRADVVLFGHTHYPLCIMEDGIVLVNPGSLKQPRGFPVPTYATLDISSENQGKKLEFRYFDPKNREILSKQRTFSLQSGTAK
jgi:putative phosphoesterase